ncbi:hypothetical protein RPIT_02000 [Tessaracoccus flavus]|uniref:Uncharacterized protein n=1 Tax=Tessaracoccus flavus TaxID=1610493 RepID=A0A1Q2CC96_9ACTN|nr:hypothetical protein RPIT_02000 [Tessaracoccus flavus]
MRGGAEVPTTVIPEAINVAMELEAVHFEDEFLTDEKIHAPNAVQHYLHSKSDPGAPQQVTNHGLESRLYGPIRHRDRRPLPRGALGQNVLQFVVGQKPTATDVVRCDHSVNGWMAGEGRRERSGERHHQPPLGPSEPTPAITPVLR